MKKFSVVVVAMVLLICMSCFCITGNAATFADSGTFGSYATAINYLTNISVIQGYTDGTYGASDMVTRQQMAIFIARIMTGNIRETWKEENATPFVDITPAHYAKAINYVYDNNIIKGVTDTEFDPDASINFEAAYTMLVRMLGYGGEEMDIGWPKTYLEKAEEIGLTTGVWETNMKDTVNRAEAAQMIYNAIRIPSSSGKLLIYDVFDMTAPKTYTITASTSVEYVTNPYNNTQSISGIKCTFSLLGLQWTDILENVSVFYTDFNGNMKSETMEISGNSILLPYGPGTYEFTFRSLGNYNKTVTVCFGKWMEDDSHDSVELLNDLKYGDSTFTFSVTPYVSATDGYVSSTCTILSDIKLQIKSAGVWNTVSQYTNVYVDMSGTSYKIYGYNGKLAYEIPFINAYNYAVKLANGEYRFVFTSAANQKNTYRFSISNADKMKISDFSASLMKTSSTTASYSYALSMDISFLGISSRAFINDSAKDMTIKYTPYNGTAVEFQSDIPWNLSSENDVLYAKTFAIAGTFGYGTYTVTFNAAGYEPYTITFEIGKYDEDGVISEVENQYKDFGIEYGGNTLKFQVKESYAGSLNFTTKVSAITLQKKNNDNLTYTNVMTWSNVESVNNGAFQLTLSGTTYTDGTYRIVITSPAGISYTKEVIVSSVERTITLGEVSYNSATKMIYIPISTMSNVRPQAVTSGTLTVAGGTPISVNPVYDAAIGQNGGYKILLANSLANGSYTILLNIDGMAKSISFVQGTKAIELGSPTYDADSKVVTVPIESYEAITLSAPLTAEDGVYFGNVKIPSETPVYVAGESGNGSFRIALIDDLSQGTYTIKLTIDGIAKELDLTIA